MGFNFLIQSETYRTFSPLQHSEHFAKNKIKWTETFDENFEIFILFYPSI